MNNSTESLENDLADSGGVRNWLALLQRHKSLIALGGVVGLVLGALAFAQKTPVYQTTAQLIVSKKQGNPLPGDTDPRNFFYEDYLATHQILIRSPVIVRRAVQKHQLQGLHAFQGNSDPTGAIRGSLVILRDSKDPTGPSSNVLNLAFSCTDPKDCATVLDAVIASYKSYLDEKFQVVSEETVQQIIRAMGSLQEELAKKTKAYEKFKQTSPLVYANGKDGASLHEDWLGHIEAKRLSLLMQRAELQGRLDAIQKALNEGRGRRALLAQITASASRHAGSNGEREPGVHEKLYDLMLREQMLLADFGPDHPEVVSVRKRMSLTREFFAQGAGGKDDDPVAWHIQSLQQQKDDIDQALGSLGQMSGVEEKKVRDVIKFKVQAQEYQREIVELREHYLPTIRRLREINFIRDLGGFNVQVIAPPLPGGRTGAGAMQIILMGGLLGLMGGFGLAYLAEVTDRSFRTPEEIRRRLGLPVVGHIPMLRPDAATMLQMAEGQACLDPLLCTVHRPKSPHAEAFRGVRTALYFSTQGENHQIIQVTSPTASDGKSTVASNLAVCIAQTGKKVVLLDADFRKPRQHCIFGLTANEGLASVVAGETELKEVILPTVVPGLSLLPCGRHPQNPAELLTSERFKELLDVLREEYDFVVVDTPPLLAVSDPSAVAPRVDGVLLTVRISKNGRPNAERARELLKSLGAKVFGVVVVSAGPQGGYGYGYGNSYYDNYGNYQDEGGYYRDESDDGNAESQHSEAARAERRKQRGLRSESRNGAPETIWGKVAAWWRK